MDQSKDRLDQFEMDIDRAHQELVCSDKIRKKTESDLAAAEAQIVSEEEKLANLIAKIPELNEKIVANAEDMKELVRQEEDLLEEVEGLERVRDEQDMTQRKLNRQIATFQEPAQVFRAKLQNMEKSGNNQVIKRAAHDTLTAMDWLEGEKQQGKFRSVLGPVGMYMTVKDPAVACMVELAVGEISLMGFIATNEAEGRGMRAEMKERRLQVDVDTMTNETIDRPIIPVSYLGQFQDIGIKGYLGDQVECEPMIRAWLYQWKKLHMVMWARTDASSKPVDESHYNLLCPDEFNASMFRLYVCDASSSSRGSGGRGKCG